MTDDTYHNPGDGGANGLRTCGTGVKLHDYGQTIGSGQPRVKHLGDGTWSVSLFGLTLADSTSRETPHGYGETLEDAYRDYVKTIKGRSVMVMRQCYDVPTDLVFL